MGEPGAIARIPRPKQMRGLSIAYTTKGIYIATALSVLVGASWKYFIYQKRKERYAEFYKNYDAEKEFEEMRKKGLFQSC